MRAAAPCTTWSNRWMLHASASGPSDMRRSMHSLFAGWRWDENLASYHGLHWPPRCWINSIAISVSCKKVLSALHNHGLNYASEIMCLIASTTWTSVKYNSLSLSCRAIKDYECILSLFYVLNQVYIKTMTCTILFIMKLFFYSSVFRCGRY